MNMISFECERTRRQLDAYLSNELLVETTSELLRHLEKCAACSQELASRVKVRDALRKAVLNQSPPDQLIDAVHRRLTRAQSARSGFWPTFQAPAWALAAASLAVVLIAVIIGKQWLGVRQGSRMVASVLTLGVSDHLYCAIRGHNYLNEGRPPDQLRERLGPEYAGLLNVVAQRLPGFQILESHQCSVPPSPRKYVHFIASGQGTILSVILTKRNGESLPNGKLLVADGSNGINLYKAQLEGMNVAGFGAQDYFGFVVSSLGQNEVLQTAAGLAPAIRGALPASVAALENKEAFEIDEGSLVATTPANAHSDIW